MREAAPDACANVAVHRALVKRDRTIDNATT
jgi:hypothetical protein